MDLISSFTAGEPQTDGRRFIEESHIAPDGRIFTYEYMADSSIDPDAVIQERARVIRAELNKREAARILVLGTEIPYTKYEFLDRFTQDERIAIRARAKLDPRAEDFMEMLNASGGVFMSLARKGLAYLTQAGVLTAERSAVIGTD